MTTADTRLPSATRVGRVALRTNDLGRLVAFYRDAVGLVVLDHDGEHATLGAGEEPLLELIADPDSPEREREETGLFHTAFRVPSRAALGDALGRIRERWTLDGASDHRVSEALYLADPEGNGVEVYWDRPREEWPTSDGTVEMDTLPLATEEIAALDNGQQRVPDETTVGHIHLEVSSLPATREFYVDGLGMNVRQEWGDSALFVAAGDYHHHVGLNTWNGRTRSKEGRGLDSFELLVPDSEALSAVRQRLAERRTEVGEEASGIALTDPDGIELRLRVASEPNSAGDG